ncbi:hypothetical protein PSENEW3_00004229 [Picochlorum sp. SENEW3]|nr:hypothetical protein PSENEW3_00004229 [Picochlorum sp. SENEW3]
MAMNPPKPRKRIVPQLLSSPTGTSKHKIDALSGPLQVDNLKEQYTQAKELLGPGRKIYVNLAPYQTEHKQVSWNRLLREEGCTDTPGKETKGTLEMYLDAITKPMTLGTDDSDSDVNDKVGGEEDGAEGSASGSEEQEEEGDGEKGGNEEAIDGTGADTNNEEEGVAAPRRRKKWKNSYDYMDDFIDDSEFIQVVEFADNRKAKHKGFVIYRGKIERDEADADSGYEYDEETGQRKRKRQRRTAPDGEKKKKEDATPKRKSVPYVMSDEMKAALETLRKMVKEHVDATAGAQEEEDGGSAKKRKIIPVSIREELIRNENVFKQETTKGGFSATNKILDELHGMLNQFAKRENLRLYVSGKVGGKSKEDVIFNTSKLKAIVASLDPVERGGEEQEASGSEDQTSSYLKNMPLELQKKVSKQIRAGLRGEQIDTEKGQTVLQEVFDCFPSGTINLDALRQLAESPESLEQKSAAEKDVDDGKTKEELNKGINNVEAMGDDIASLDFEGAVQKAMEHGAPEAEMRACLDGVKDDEFLFPLFKMLAVAGPCGLKIKYAAIHGQKTGLYRKTIVVRSVTSAITRRIKENDDIVLLKDSKGFYALKYMPGVVPAPPKSTKNLET